MKNVLVASIFLSVAAPCGFYAAPVEAQVVGGRFPAKPGATRSRAERLADRLAGAEERLAEVDERLEALRGPEDAPTTRTPAQQREVDQLTRRKVQLEAEIERLNAQLDED